MSLFTWAGGALFFLSLVHFLWRYFFLYGAPAPETADAATALAINAALFSVFALHHSILARTRAKAWVRRHVPPALERSLYVWAASLLFVATCAFWQPVPGVAWHVVGWPAGLVWAGQLAGVAMTAWSAAMLGVLELAGIRATEPGEGVAELRSDGPYGLVRHPIYFAWLLLVWSVPFMNGTRLSFAAISTFYLVVAVPFEERSLAAGFGPAYARYKTKVRWRMIPFVY